MHILGKESEIIKKMPDTDGYPTKTELDKVRKWNLIKDGDIRDSAINLIEYIRSIWWYGDKYVVFKRGRLQLHTVGWSGNESIIDALMKQQQFWWLYWKKSERGGHYYFDGINRKYG